MMGSYLVLAIRNLFRHKMISVINMMGISMQQSLIWFKYSSTSELYACIPQSSRPDTNKS